MTHAPESFVGSRYHLLQPLGQGGMGEVFCALDRLSGAEVALKRVSLRSGSSSASPERLRPGTPVAPVIVDQATLAALDPAALSGATLESPRVYVQTDARSDALRFALAQEFRTLASLRHPNIISVLDYGFDAERQPYFTMELLVGARPLLAASAELTLSHKVSLLAQLLLALNYLHRRGVLHRIITPPNNRLLSTRSRTRGTPVIGTRAVIEEGYSGSVYRVSDRPS